MFRRLSQKFTHFSGRFTYRHRFFFWSFLYFSLVPAPAYWILQTQHWYSAQADLQLKGSAEAKSWLGVLDAMLVYYIEWAHAVAFGDEAEVRLDAVKHAIDDKMAEVRAKAVTREFEEIPRVSMVHSNYLVVNYQDDAIFLEELWDQIVKISKTTDLYALLPLYQAALARLTHHLHQVVYEYHLVLQTSDILQRLSQAIYFPLVQGQIEMAMLSVSLDQLKKAKQVSADALAEMQLKTASMEQQFQHTLSEIESIFTATEKMPLWETLKFHASYQNLTDCTAQSLSLINRVRDNLVPFNPHLEAWAESYALFTKNVSCIANIRQTANSLFDVLLDEEEHFYHVQQIFDFVYLLGIAIMLIIFLSFRFLTRHFLQLQTFIEGLTQGKLLPIVTPVPTEEMGQIAQALKKMGTAIKHIVEELQTLDQGVADASEAMEKTARSQTEAVILQEKFLETLDSNIRNIAAKSRELAETTRLFSRMSEESTQADRGQKELNQMQGKMDSLKSASNNIMESLAVVHNKEQSTRSVTILMTKISEQASLLALNAAIEALSVGPHIESFKDTTDKIHNFSKKTSGATQSIQKVVREMGESVSIGRTTAESCIKEITVGANRLIEVGGQLKTIATQEEVQDEKFRLVNKMMHNQASVSENIISSVTSLNNLSTENNVAVRQLYQTVLELGKTTQELRGVVSALFVDQKDEEND